MQHMVAGSPWERVGMDLTDKHPRSLRGNYYILTYLDHFTKFAEAYLIPNKEAETICRVLVEEIFPRFGVSIQLLTNQGREFDNQLMKGISDVYGSIRSVLAPMDLLPTVLPNAFIGHLIPCWVKS